MNRRITYSEIITYTVIAIALLFMVCVWPLKLIERNVVSKSEEVFETESGVCNSEHIIGQVFASRGTSLDSIDVYVCNDVQGEEIKAVIYDGTLTEIQSKTVKVENDVSVPGFVNIPIILDTERGSAYILSVSGVECDLVVGLEDHNSSTNTDVYAISYDGTEDPDHNIIVRYNYTVEFAWWQILLIDIFAIILSVVLILVGRKLFGTRLADREVGVQKFLQFTLNPIIVAISILLMWQVFPKKIYSEKLVNIIIWDIGILLMTLWLLYEVNYKRSDDTKLISLDFVKDHIQGWIISIAFAHVLWFCFEYMNGLYEIHHVYASRKVLVWLLITLICTFTKKELLNVVNLVWLIAGSILSYLYAKPYIGSGEDELTYRLNAYIIFLGIFVIINIVSRLIKLISDGEIVLRLRQINKLYTIPFVLFFVMICALANTREWPGFFALMTALFVLRLFVWKREDKWLEYLCNAIIVNFIFMLVFSLLHRPFYGYIYHRYNMCYMTVTMTATHLTMTLAATGVKLFVMNRRYEDKRKLFPWLVLFGVIANYMLFTLSRTGYIAVIGMMIIALIVISYMYCEKGHRLYDICRNLLVCIVMLLVCYPSTFTFTRIIPPLYDEPVIYEYEPCKVTINKGDAPNQEYYMDLPRFIEVFASKVLGIGDATADASDELYWINDLRYCENSVQYVDASGDIDAGDIPQEISNGRFDIFRSYLEQSNTWGHDDMGALLPDGSIGMHAHNIYIQAIYDHGWIAGIYFFIFLVFSWVLSIVYAVRNRESNEYSLLVCILLTGFMVAGLVEWIFHPCNPYCLAVMMSLCTMIFNSKAYETSN